MTTQLTGPAAAPGKARRDLDRVVPWAAAAWLLAYGVLRAYWAAGNQPQDMSPAGPDLVVFTGWRGVALCGAAAAVLLALAHPAARHRTGRVLRLAAWTAAAALAAAAAMLLLDVIGAVLPGLGVAFHPLGALSRAACAAAAVLTGLAARAHRRRTRGGCGGCGRAAAAAGPLDRTPAWAYRAAYLAVAGCAARVAAQAAVGFGGAPLSGGASALLFEAGFVLGGTLLPLALVHPFGRTWPRPLPVLGGRRVPRRLVLWLAAAVSAGLTVYFGLMLLLMCWERLHGRDPFPPEGGLDLPEAFFWAAVPAYVLWGAGMAVAARAYARRTRVPCPGCGR
ncbi:hypothetical protein [Actinomadura livida]|uniref:DUF3995 domain-containing protein n=1 Tax=Actinomadura livida TaxID=79909 RepID=A0A7W7IDZ5_9ACTN|nr:MULTISPECIES: hypothetical protein [Actinomadura]MBB4775362.1 hypothetical protein [Actinomadura catellatispora]GGT89830.1 hypothetical protein GCM10010208_10760 [Actinomadura livida]